MSQPAHRRKPAVAAYWYLLLVPIFAVLSAIEFYPLVYSLYLSLTGPGGALSAANYAQMVTDGDFWSAVAVSLTFSVLSTAMAVAIGLGLTFLLVQKARGRGWFEGIFILPLAVAPVAAGVLWGPASFWDDFQSLMHFVFGLPFFQEIQIGFYFPAMSATEAWEWAPLIMLVALSIINSAPKEVYDAAKVHGASSWSLFTKVMLPTVFRSPVMQFVLVLRFIDAMNSFSVPLAWSTWIGVPTQVGTPVDTLSLYLYKLLFVPSFGFPINLVSAIAVALLVVTLVSATVMMRLLGSIGGSGGR
jgi:ABC-type sugar transport system permease subunit